MLGYEEGLPGRKGLVPSKTSSKEAGLSRGHGGDDDDGVAGYEGYKMKLEEVEEKVLNGGGG